MATKPRNLFLYLTLACFLGLIALFIIDGYMGVYDTIFITAGEREQKIDSDVWLRGDKFWTTGVNRGEKLFFRYEVDNRKFAYYSAEVEVSVWRMQEKLLDVTLKPLAVASFDKEQFEWEIDTKEIVPSDAPPEQSYEYTVLISRGEIERNIIIYINPVPYPQKPPLPIPTR
jgi:putative lipase involved disintegration of autophagic bodies